jgi:hypothetical protein
MNELTSVFISICEPLLKEPNIPPHNFAIAKDNESAFVEFPARNRSGFDVDIAVNDGGIILSGGELWHRHLKLEMVARPLVEEVFGHARTLLCPDARLIEKYSNNNVYKATIEEFDGENWISGDSVTLYFWNYFGQRTKKILINEHLPARITD